MAPLGTKFARTADGFQQAKATIGEFFPTSALIFNALRLEEGEVDMTFQGYFTDKWQTCDYYYPQYPFAQIELSSNPALDAQNNNYCGMNNLIQPRMGTIGESYSPTWGVVNVVMNGLTSAMISGASPAASSPIGSTNPQVTVGVRPLPYKTESSGDASDQELIATLNRFMGSFMVPMATSFLLPVFVFHIVHEKELKLRSVMLMMGLKMRLYWLVQYLFDLTLGLTTLYGVYIFGLIFSLPIFTNQQFGIILILFFIWCQVLISMGFLFSALFNKTRNANIFLYLFVLASVIGSLLVNELVFLKTPYLPAPGYWVWMPQMAYYRCIYLLSMRSYYFEDLGASDELVQLWGVMILQTVVMFLLAAYFDIVIPKEYGMNRGPFFFIQDMVKCCKRRNTVKGEKTLVIDHVEDGDDEEEDFFAEEDVDVTNERQLILSGGVDNAPIRVVNLKKKFGNFKAVDGLFLHMEDKRCFGLLGPNGAGKSTTISMLTGLYGPSTGNAWVNGYSIRSNMDNVYESIGICPQHDVTFPELTVGEHLYLFARIKGVQRSDEKRLVTSALHAVQLAAHGKKKSRQLSGGQRRRLSIAISLLGNPRCVFLDEPTTGVDPTTRAAIHGLILKEKKKRCVVLTTHLMAEAEKLSDNIGIMTHGKLATIGSPQNLKTKYSEGFKIILVTNNDSLTKNFIQENMSGAKLESHINQKMTFEVDQSKINIGEAFTMLRSTSPDASGIVDFGLRMTSLEEVFVQLAKRSEEIHGTA